MTIQAQYSETGTVGYLRATSDRATKQKSECKASTAFRTISEVATNLDVPQHVLRFWETKFHQIRPLKRGGGRRYYRPEDIALLTNIKELLYGKGMTIRGVQKLLSEGFRSEIKRVSTRSQEGTQELPQDARKDSGAMGSSSAAALAKTATTGLLARPKKDAESFAPEAETASSVVESLESRLTSATVTVAGKSTTLPMQTRRELESVLAELRTLRDLLRQAGV